MADVGTLSMFFESKHNTFVIFIFYFLFFQSQHRRTRGEGQGMTTVRHGVTE